MIGNKLEQSIIEVFQNDLSSTFSINQISKILKKSYPIINQKCNFLLDEGVLRKINIGRSYQCSLNVTNEKARILMSVNELNKRDEFIQKNKHVEGIIDEISQLSKKFEIETVILSKKNILIVMNGNEDKDFSSRKKDLLEIRSLTKDHILAFYDLDSFKNKFLTDIELQKYHIVLSNTDLYINMVATAVDELITRKILDVKQNNTDARDTE